MDETRPFDDEGKAVRVSAQREANAEAQRQGSPLPYPNIWDVLDPTKLPRDASEAQIHERYKEFSKLCRRRPRKRHAL